MGLWWNTAQKMKFSIKDFFSKCDQIHRKLHFLVSEDEWRSIKGECKGKWGGGISGGFDGSLNKSEEDIWGDEGWENDTCEAGLWAIDFDWKCTVGAVAGNGIITDGCGGKDETACDVKAGPDRDGYSTVRSEGVINGTSEFSVWPGSGRAVFNGRLSKWRC